MINETVAVGVDQSAQSRAALEWAADYARRTGASLHVISVHPHWRPALPYAVGVAGIPLSDDQDWVNQAHAAINQMFDSIKPEPHWTLTQIDGEPGVELVRAAHGVGLLVVGTREHTGINRYLEGSVSHYCLRHAGVPVVAVPVKEVAAVETIPVEQPTVESAAGSTTGV
jgi:nucleotide-binding universal stress UspA family protein